MALAFIEISAQNLINTRNKYKIANVINIVYERN